MNLSCLKPAEGATKREKKRLGRGQGCGKGGTSTRGHKGAKSVSGYSRKKGFEGGQMSLIRRVPKFGFTSLNRNEFKAINLEVLQRVADKMNLDSISHQDLIQAGLIAKKDLVKILGKGKLTKKLDVKAHSFSQSAINAIEALGGKAEKL
jgi:large subunit ribosomal protein L15